MEQITNPVAFNCEKRAFPLKLEKITHETRSRDGQSVEILTGKAMALDEFTTIIDRWGDEFQEKFTKNCMDETLADGHKIMALYNHSWLALMGSTADNLTLALKDDGLYFEFIPKNFEFDRRIIEFIKSGTIDGCSIGFRALEWYWEEKDGTFFRIITKIELYEITFTPIPAYSQTSVEVEVRKADVAAPPPQSSGESDIEERSRILAEVDKLLETLG